MTIEDFLPIVEAVTGVILVKRGINNEKITVPYHNQTIFSTKFGPIVSVDKVEFFYHGEYQTGPNQNFITTDFNTLQFRSCNCGACFHGRYLPKGIGAVRISYTAGYYDSVADIPPSIMELLNQLLAYFNGKSGGDFKSEHFDSYSYTQGDTTYGLPAYIVAIFTAIKERLA